MMYDKFRAKNSRSNLLSAVDILGTFDFWTCLISLDSLESRDLHAMKSEDEKSLSDNGVLRLRKIIPLAIHEYTHFLDTVSTVWGINHLSMMNAAYLCDDRRGCDEATFFAAKIFADHLRRIKYPEYYTVIYNAGEKPPWRAQPSVGKLFLSDGMLSDESVVFLRFSSCDDMPLVRSPISPASILEASAMAQESLCEAQLLNGHSLDYKSIEANSFQKKLLDFLYNKNVTEYSVCVHMLANQQKCKDVLQAFSLLARIVRVVLNSTDQVFEIILEANRMRDILGVAKNHEMVAALETGLKYRNLGVLYYLIVSALPENSYLTEDSARAGVVAAINLLGCDLGFIEKSSSEYIAVTLKRILETDIASIARLAKAGKANFDLVDMSSAYIPFHKLSLPKVMLGDGSETLIFPPEHNLLSDFDIDACFEELANGERWVKRFAESCL